MDRVNYCGVMLHEADHSRVAQTPDHEGDNAIAEHDSLATLSLPGCARTRAFAAEAAANAGVVSKTPDGNSPTVQNALLSQLDGRMTLTTTVILLKM